MLIRRRLTSRPTNWPATKGPISTGVKVSPSSSANVRVNPGSPARTMTHHRAPICHRRILRPRERTPSAPSVAQVTHRAAGSRPRSTPRTEAIRSASTPAVCGIQPSGMTPWLAMIGSDITG